MISKIIGLVFIAPFLALLLNAINATTSEVLTGYKKSPQELGEGFFNWCVLLFVVEMFGVGLYLLLK